MYDTNTIARLNAQHAHRTQDSPVPTGSVVTVFGVLRGRDAKDLAELLSGNVDNFAAGHTTNGDGKPDLDVAFFKVTKPGIRTADVHEILENSATTWSHGLRQYTHSKV